MMARTKQKLNLLAILLSGLSCLISSSAFPLIWLLIEYTMLLQFISSLRNPAMHIYTAGAVRVASSLILRWTLLFVPL
jgi:hypothetical protein